MLYTKYRRAEGQLVILFVCFCFLIFSVLVAIPKSIGVRTLHGGQSRSWSAEQGKENKKRKSGSTTSPPPATKLL